MHHKVSMQTMCKLNLQDIVLSVECCNIPAQAAAGYYMNTQFPPLLIDNCSLQLIPTQGDKKLNIWFCENVQLLRLSAHSLCCDTADLRVKLKVVCDSFLIYPHLYQSRRVKRSFSLSSHQTVCCLFYFPPCQLSTVCQDITIVADHILSSQPIFNFPKSD